MKASILFLLLMLSAGTVLAAPLRLDCAVAVPAWRSEQVKVPTHLSSRRVLGRARLYFHSAPDSSCRLREVFVIHGDTLQAHNEYGTFTEVVYVNPRTGRSTSGWVDTGRLQDDSDAAASR
jgi:hypothetical protein